MKPGNDPRHGDRDRARSAVETAWRLEWPQLVATLTRMIGDIDLAEDLAQDALVAALDQWPREGVPPRPGAWLTKTAKHRAIDRLRRDQNLATKLAQLARVDHPPSTSEAETSGISDDLLRMIFTACHPVLSQQAQVALTLRLVGGLTVEEIAHAYLVSPATLSQRIVRAKRTIATERVPYVVPEGEELARRLEAVLDVICLIFTEGYTATSGPTWLRLDLAEEGLRLARVLAQLLPTEPEVHGLAALVQLQASRVRARTDINAALILLTEQDRSRWDQLLIRRGFLALHRAQELNREGGRPPGRFALQAAIAAEHAIAHTPEATNWARLVKLYDQLGARYPSPVVALNRAVAVGMAEGPADGLAALEEITASRRLDNYHLLAAVRGDLLRRVGSLDAAAAEYERAAALASNEAEQHLLRTRASQCAAR